MARSGQILLVHNLKVAGTNPARAIGYRSNFALTRPAISGLNEARRIRSDMICACQRQTMSIEDASLIPSAYGTKTGVGARFGGQDEKSRKSAGLCQRSRIESRILTESA